MFFSFLKVFVRYFSAALQTEYRSKGIIVQVCKQYMTNALDTLFQCVSPAFVATAMSGIRRPSLFAPDPVTYAKRAVATIGLREHTNAYLPHVLQVI